MSNLTPRAAKRVAVCNTCTARLVAIAYERKPLFRLVREPLSLGMRAFAWLYRIDPDGYEVRTPQCGGCARFYKTALKERSTIFRRLNDFFNPLFDMELERIVTADEMSAAKEHARRATAGCMDEGQQNVGPPPGTKSPGRD